MPAIASLEDLKSAQRDGRSKFLIVTPCALRLRVKEARADEISERKK